MESGRDPRFDAFPFRALSWALIAVLWLEWPLAYAGMACLVAAVILDHRRYFGSSAVAFLADVTFLAMSVMAGYLREYTREGR